jgi:hypothetical protein
MGSHFAHVMSWDRPIVNPLEPSQVRYSSLGPYCLDNTQEIGVIVEARIVEARIASVVGEVLGSVTRFQTQPPTS